MRTPVISHRPMGLYALQDGNLASRPSIHRPAEPIVHDTGAGDAAQAAIVDSLLRGLPLEIALLAGVRRGSKPVPLLRDHLPAR